MADPDFGDLLFMFISNAPERSYWEGEWLFPKTGTMVSISLPGGEEGPLPEARKFYLQLPERFEQILAAASPKLKEVLAHWLSQDLPEDVFSAIELTGFGLKFFDGLLFGLRRWWLSG